MSDGAHQGVGAERALKTILGGEEQPSEEEQQTPAEMLDQIREASLTPGSYGDAALACARLILETYEKYPTLRDQPTEGVYLKGQDGMLVIAADKGLVPLVHSLHDILKRLHDEDSPEREILSGLTGFMWGWAVNAVGYALGDPPKPNPAIAEIAT